MFLSIFIFLLPFFFLPITSDFYNLNKQFFLAITVFVLAVKTLNNVLKRPTKQACLHKQVLVSSLDILVLLFFVAIAFSSLAGNNGKLNLQWINTFLGPGDFLLFTSFYFLIKTHEFTEEKKQRLIIFFLFSGVVFSLLLIFHQFSLGKISSDPFWSPLGHFSNILSFSLFLTLSSSLYLVYQLFFAEKNYFTINLQKQNLSLPKSKNQIVNLLIILAITSGFILLVSSYSLLSQKGIKPLFLDHNNGWWIAVSGMRDFSKALFGFGPGNFFTALAQNRPEQLYFLPLSGQNITIQSNLLLQILSEYGLLGLFAFVSWIFYLLKKIVSGLFFSSDNHLILTCLVFGILVSQFFYPASFILVFYLYLFLGLFTDEPKWHFNLTEKTGKILTSVFLVLYCLLFLFYAKNYLADFYYAKFINAKNQQEAKSNLKSAIIFNAKNPYYHLAFSKYYKNTALNLFSLKDYPKKELKTNVGLAVSEMEKSLLLDKNNPVLLFETGKMYFDFANVATGSAETAIKFLNASVQIDRTNPLYHLTLGKAYLYKKDFFRAQKEFELATIINPSYTNAFYNLYYAYYQQGYLNLALNALIQTRNSLSPSSPQYEKVNEELVGFSEYVKNSDGNASDKNQSFGSLNSL